MTKLDFSLVTRAFANEHRYVFRGMHNFVFYSKIYIWVEIQIKNGLGFDMIYSNPLKFSGIGFMSIWVIFFLLQCK